MSYSTQVENMTKYLYQHSRWPNFVWDDNELSGLLKKVNNELVKLNKLVENLGFSEKGQAQLDALVSDVLKSSEIEGELLNMEQVRSSVARQLGLDVAGLVASGRDVDGVVKMMVDATSNYKEILSRERLFAWHKDLFPDAKRHRIIIGDWRDDSTGPMQVVSGPIGKGKVHYEAPAAKLVDKEMAAFLKWFNKNDKTDAILKAGIAHLWFVTVHPFEDGNGRIARAITDMQLTRADKNHRRFYSMSAQIMAKRKDYYLVLEETQKNNLDITHWLVWFLERLAEAIIECYYKINRVLEKSRFWVKYANVPINERQRLMINKLYGDFFGSLTSTKWAKIVKCSHDTALRDIKDLIDKGILQQEAGGGRNTGYALAGEKKK